MCTDFSIVAHNGDIIIGRSMELGIDLNSQLFFRGSDFSYTQTPDSELIQQIESSGEITFRKDLPLPEARFSWKGQYGFIGMNAFGQPIASNGMNTEGLTTGTMVLAQSCYQALRCIDGQRNEQNALFYPYLSSWILSTCANCQDVIDGLQVDKLTSKTLSLSKDKDQKDKLIVADPFTDIPVAFKFHFPVQDAEGNSIVLEFVDGELHASDLNPIGVLTNDPLIAWQQENVTTNYVNLSPVNVQNADNFEGMQGNNFTGMSYGQGTGFEGLPGSSTPIDRFVRAAMMTNYAFPVATGNEAVTQAFHVLNTVDIPKGTSREKLDQKKLGCHQDTPISDYTQWVTVSDLTNKTYNIRMYDSPLVFSVSLMDLDLARLESAIFPLPVQKQSTSITDNIESLYAPAQA
ncbi:hypothetical protein ACH42_11980 [Endozoicomonas sp. (ex Bugula neritina AB1)]|nr:hypothetical protein ACH42_11980 [Endozoicomonas sp. (ex Bugula neritina AB1)]